MPLSKVDLTANLTPLKWLVPGLFISGYVNFVGALQGTGKTALMAGLLWQMSRPNGGTFLGEPVEHGATIYCDFDAPGSGARGLRYWLEKHRAAYPDGDLSKITVLEPDKGTFSLGESEFKELATIAKDVDAKGIVVDSFTMAFPGVDTVKLNAVTAPMWYLRNFADETGACVVVVDHLPKVQRDEKVGARGLIGSIAKPAQARAVHIVSTVPPKDVGGRNVLKWDVQKMSFAALPEPFGVELRFDAGKLYVEETDLPDSYGETRKEQAQRAMLNLLVSQRGLAVSRKDLLSEGIRTGNVKERTAIAALTRLLVSLSDEVVPITLPGPGQPLAYRLKVEDEGQPAEEETPDPSTTAASMHQIAESPSGTEESLMQPPLPETGALHQIEPAPPLDLDSLELRLDSGEFLKVSGFLGGVYRGNLEPALIRFTRRARAGDAEAMKVLTDFQGAQP